MGSWLTSYLAEDSLPARKKLNLPKFLPYMLIIRFGEGAVTSSALLFSPAMSLRRVMVKIPALNDWECGSVPAAFNSHRWAGELHFYRHLLAALRRGIHSYCQWDRPEHAVVYALPVILLQENNDIPFLLCSRSDVREKGVLSVFFVCAFVASASWRVLLLYGFCSKFPLGSGQKRFYVVYACLEIFSSYVLKRLQPRDK